MLVRYPILPYVTPRNKILFWNSEWVFMNKNHENNLCSARSRCFHRIIRKQKAAQLSQRIFVGHTGIDYCPKQSVIRSKSSVVQSNGSSYVQSGEQNGFYYIVKAIFNFIPF